MVGHESSCMRIRDYGYIAYIQLAILHGNCVTKVIIPIPHRSTKHGYSEVYSSHSAETYSIALCHCVVYTLYPQTIAGRSEGGTAEHLKSQRKLYYGTKIRVNAWVCNKRIDHYTNVMISNCCG